MNHKQLETLEEQKANWERYGNTQLELLDREAIRREVDSDRYVGALLDHSGGHIHPLNLAIGEADAIRLNGGGCMSSRRSPASSTPAWRWSAPRAARSPRAT